MIPQYFTGITNTKEILMKKRIKLALYIAVVLICMVGCKKNANEVEEIIIDFQAEINNGNFDKAGSYCQMEDGTSGTWFCEDLVSNEDDSIPITAAKEICLEKFEINIDLVEIDGEVATVKTEISSVNSSAFLNSMPKNYSIDQLNSASVDDCKKMFDEDVNDYIFSFEAKIICKKIDGQWKITNITE